MTSTSISILDREAVGQSAPPTTFSYDWKALATYAVGIGAKKDELDYLYEGRGPKVYPTFAVVPAFPSMMAAIGLTKGDVTTVVHGSQSVRVKKPIGPKGTLTSTGRVAGIFDMKKLANVHLVVDTCDEAGDIVYESDWNILFRGPVAPGSPPPPKSEAPSVPRERPADVRIVEATTPEQALLYRLSGDPNPLHADPAFAAEVGFPQGPILHGLCTYGHAARAVINGLLGGDASRLTRFDCQFRKPVWPGDVLITDIWKLDDGRVSVSTLVEGKNDPVLTQCWGQIVD
jgi:acyl dehydratase